VLSTYYRTRLLVLTAATVCFILFWWAGRAFGIPIHPGYQASLLLQPSPAADLLVVAVLMAACVAVGTILAGSVQRDAGLAAACLGLMAWSFRGGDSERTWFWGLAVGKAPQGLFMNLFLEMLILALIITACWLGLRMLQDRGILDQGGQKTADDPPRAGLLALVVQVVAGAVVVMLVAQSTAKLQVMAAAFLCGLAGPMVSRWLVPTSARGWHFAAPLIVGMIGYLAAGADPAGTATGDLSGTLAALARPLPLDYASAGPAGAILGHWMARHWNDGEEPAAAPEAGSQAQAAR
jgi:hypothetical protein